MIESTEDIFKDRVIPNLTESLKQEIRISLEKAHKAEEGKIEEIIERNSELQTAAMRVIAHEFSGIPGSPVDTDQDIADPK